MWRPLILLGLFLLPGGCAYWRGEPPIAVAPDPVTYPAPAQEARYLPWVGALTGPPAR